jgi:hypothetical protein
MGIFLHLDFFFWSHGAKPRRFANSLLLAAESDDAGFKLIEFEGTYDRSQCVRE